MHEGRSATREFTAKGRATRERVLQSAAQVLLSEGLSGFNLEKVRQAAGVSGSQLTHYFADRPALLRAVLERQIEVVLDFHRQPTLGGLDRFEDFERWADLNVKHLRAIGYATSPTYHSLAGRLAKADAATRQTLANGYWRWVALLEECFSRMVDSGLLLPSTDPRHLALVLVGVHQGAGTLTFAYRQEWPLVDAMRFVVDYVRGFAADPADRVGSWKRRPRGARRGAAGTEVVDDADARLTEKGALTRARIVECAADLMFDKGVHATSLADVRKASRVSGSQLTHYFADKRALVRRVIAMRSDEVLRFHTQPALGHFDDMAKLRAWVDTCLAATETTYLRGGCVYGSLTGELLEADEGILDDLAAGYDRWISLFHGGLRSMRARGVLAADCDPRHLAVAMVAAHQGGAMLVHATGTPEPVQATLRAAVAHVAGFETDSVPART
jgi:AcrR family transcriptional regulator